MKNIGKIAIAIGFLLIGISPIIVYNSAHKKVELFMKEHPEFKDKTFYALDNSPNSNRDGQQELIVDQSTMKPQIGYFVIEFDDSTVYEISKENAVTKISGGYFYDLFHQPPAYLICLSLLLIVGGFCTLSYTNSKA